MTSTPTSFQMPYNKMKPLQSILLLNSKKSLHHMQKRPPEICIACRATHCTPLSPHKAWQSSLLTCSLFISWIHNICTIPFFTIGSSNVHHLLLVSWFKNNQLINSNILFTPVVDPHWFCKGNQFCCFLFLLSLFEQYIAILYTFEILLMDSPNLHLKSLFCDDLLHETLGM